MAKVTAMRIATTELQNGNVELVYKTRDGKNSDKIRVTCSRDEQGVLKIDAIEGDLQMRSHLNAVMRHATLLLSN